MFGLLLHFGSKPREGAPRTSPDWDLCGRRRHLRGEPDAGRRSGTASERTMKCWSVAFFLGGGDRGRSGTLVSG